VRVPTSLPSAGRWLAVLIPVVDVALVLSGVLDVRTGVIVGVVLETLLAVVLVAEARTFRTAYLRARAAGRRPSAAAAQGFEAAWPPLVLTLVRAEIGMIRSLWWALRRRRAVGPGDVALAYGDRFTLMLGVVCCLGAVELGVVHVLTARWPVVQWSLFALGIYALLWILGFGFSLRQRPHLLRNGEVLLRFGHFHSVRVPVERVVSVRSGAVSGHRRNLVLDGDALTMAVMGDSNLELRFEPPVAIEVGAVSRTFTRVAFFVDDPRAAAALLRTAAVSADG
jgi:hypothetical protein